MKRFLAVFVLLFMVLQLYSASEADLTIKAFKSYNTGVRVIINNRITREDIFVLNSNPNEASTTGNPRIELNDVVQQLLGSVSDTSTQVSPSALDSYVVFSYRVEGNVTGSYSLRFDLNNLTNSNNQNEYINTSYQLGNFDAVFTSSATSGVPSGNLDPVSNNDYAIMYDDTSVKEGSAIGVSGVTTLTSSWTVGEPIYQENELTGVQDGATEPCSTWIARGAVGMTIDSVGYTNASNGEYIATVNVTLVCP